MCDVRCLPLCPHDVNYICSFYDQRYIHWIHHCVHGKFDGRKEKQLGKFPTHLLSPIQVESTHEHLSTFVSIWMTLAVHLIAGRSFSFVICPSENCAWLIWRKEGEAIGKISDPLFAVAHPGRICSRTSLHIHLHLDDSSYSPHCRSPIFICHLSLRKFPTFLLSPIQVESTHEHLSTFVSHHPFSSYSLCCRSPIFICHPSLIWHLSSIVTPYYVCLVEDWCPLTFQKTENW